MTKEEAVHNIVRQYEEERQVRVFSCIPKILIILLFNGLDSNKYTKNDTRRTAYSNLWVRILKITLKCPLITDTFMLGLNSYIDRNLLIVLSLCYT